VAIDLSFLIKAKDDTKGGIGSAEKGFKGLANAVKNMGMSQIMMLGGVTLAVKSMIDSYMTQELANKKLETALGHTSQALLDFASARQQVTRFGDEETTQAMSLTAAYTRNEQTIKRLMFAAQDLAEAKGIDLVTATDMLSKSIFTESNMLKRYGIDIGSTTDSSKKLELAIKRLAEMYGGQALKAMDTASGRLIIMKNNLGEVKETLGRLLLEGLQPMVKLINDLALSFQKLPEPIQKSSLAVGLFLAVVKGLGLALGPGGWLILAMVALLPLISSQIDKWKDVTLKVNEYAKGLQNAHKAMLLFEQREIAKQITEAEEELGKATGAGYQFAAMLAAGGGAGVAFAQRMNIPLENISTKLQMLYGKQKALDELMAGKRFGEKIPGEPESRPDIIGGKDKSKEATAAQREFYNEVSRMAFDNYQLKNKLTQDEYENFLTNLNTSLAAEAEYYNQRKAFIDESVIIFNEAKQQEVQSSVDANKAMIEGAMALREEYLLSDQEREIQALADKMDVNGKYFQQSKEMQEAYQKQVGLINKKYRNQEKQMWAQNLQSMGQQAINTLGNMAGNAISGAFQRTFSGIKDGFGRALVDMLSMFVSMIAEMIIRWLAFKALTSMFGAGFFFSQGTSRVPSPSFAQGTSWVPKYSQGNMSIPGMLMPTIAYAQSGMQTRGSDTIPAMLTPGEAVIPAAQTRKNLPAISQIISGQSPTSGTAKGGDSYNLSFKIDAVDGDSVERVVNSASFRKSIVDLITDNKINLKVQNNQVVASR
jgi:hypothetical protein